MGKSRIEAFSDGVIAIALTIMVLELKAPHDLTIPALVALLPQWFGYALSFVFIAIYWNNHHHMFHVVKKVDSTTLWANNHLLFWLTMVPFVTAVMGEHPLEPLALSLYGAVLLMAGFAYYVLTTQIVKSHRASPELAEALGTGWKGYLSLGSYLVAIVAAWVAPWFSQGLFVMVAAIWLIPDRRIEQHVTAKD